MGLSLCGHVVVPHDGLLPVQFDLTIATSDLERHSLHFGAVKMLPRFFDHLGRDNLVRPNNIIVILRTIMFSVGILVGYLLKRYKIHIGVDKKAVYITNPKPIMEDHCVGELM